MNATPLLVLLVACGGGTSDDATPPTDPMTTETPDPDPTGDTAPPIPGPELDVVDGVNYAFEATWTLQTQPIRAEFDVVLSWATLTTDAWGVVREASSYDKVLLFETSLDADEFAERLAADGLNGPDVQAVWQTDAGGVGFVQLADLVADEIQLDPSTVFVQLGGKTWVVALADEVGDRLDVRAAMVVVPADLDQNVQVHIEDDTSAVTWSATLSDEVLQTAEVHDRYMADWRALINDAHGQEYSRFQNKRLYIGRWDSGAPDPAQMLDLGSTASAVWSMETTDEDEALLELARDSKAASFTGFTASGTWMMWEHCVDCFGPAPLWAVAVQVQ